MIEKQLKEDIKNMIINTLELEDITISDIEDDTPLFNDGLELDSIDALELGVAIKKHYQINIQDDDEEQIKKYFYSVNTLVELVLEKGKR